MMDTNGWYKKYVPVTQRCNDIIAVNLNPGNDDTEISMPRTQGVGRGNDSFMSEDALHAAISYFNNVHQTNMFSSNTSNSTQRVPHLPPMAPLMASSPNPSTQRVPHLPPMAPLMASSPTNNSPAARYLAANLFGGNPSTRNHDQIVSPLSGTKLCNGFNDVRSGAAKRHPPVDEIEDVEGSQVSQITLDCASSICEATVNVTTKERTKVNLMDIMTAFSVDNGQLRCNKCGILSTEKNQNDNLGWAGDHLLDDCDGELSLSQLISRLFHMYIPTCYN